MGSSGSAVVQSIVAVLLLVVALAPLALSVSPADEVVAPGYSTPSADPPYFEEKATSTVSDPAVDRVEQRVRIIAKLRGNIDVSQSVPDKYAKMVKRTGERRLTGEIPLSEVSSLSQAPGVTGIRIEGQDLTATGRDAQIAPGIDRIGVDRLHEAEVTGENVTIGVIDSGYDLNHPAIAPHLGAYRSFGTTGPVDHGTSVANVVSDTAPGSELHLAAIGTSTSPEEYRSAVTWLRESGADVIVDSGSYFGQPPDGTGTLATIAENASDGVAFVTSAGNYANRHWSGTHHPNNATKWVNFSGDVQGNHLTEARQVGGRIKASLHWNGSGDYDLFLMRDTPAGDTVVASSEEYTGPGDQSREYLSATVPLDRYYVAIAANGTNGSRHLELFTSHDLRYSTANGSLTAPATAENVTVVGSYGEDAIEPFSSRGPLTDGRRGIDVVAPDDIVVDGEVRSGGTSFSAPYVAGTIALVSSLDNVTVEQAESIVVHTASDVGAEGPDPVTGYGTVDAIEAVSAVAGGEFLERRATENGEGEDEGSDTPDSPPRGWPR